MSWVTGSLIWDAASETLFVQWTNARGNPTRAPITAPYDAFDSEVLLAEYFGDRAALHERPVRLVRGNRGEQQGAARIRRIVEIEQRRANRDTDGGLYNPYGFIPVFPRDAEGPLADAPPASHGSYAPDRWSGVIIVQLTTHTPLLLRRHSRSAQIPDRAADKEHRIYDTRRLPGGKPDLHPTALKGMLSAAYESLTNSRMRVFAHDVPLTQRLLQHETAPPTPDRPTGLVAVEVTPAAGDGLIITQMAQVRLPRYLEGAGWQVVAARAALDRRGQDENPGYDRAAALHIADRVLTHGMRVRFDSFDPDHHGGAMAWRVEPAANAPQAGYAQDGWVVLTGRNPSTSTKLHEAIFTRPAHAVVHTLTGEEAQRIVQRWRGVVMATRDARTQPNPIIPVGGWLLRDPDVDVDLPAVLHRDNGRVLCWARLTPEGAIDQLVPNRYGRVAHAHTPWEALPESIRPATRRDRLAPADRLFGWTAPGGETGSAGRHRGQVKVARVRCETDPAAAISDFSAVPKLLRPLASPKPTQVLFYTAQDARGTPWDDRSLQDARHGAYGTNGREIRGIRGRKVYPARNGSSFGQNGYADRSGARTPLNSTITSWVNLGVTFSFELRITNLGSEELGALLWLITRPVDHRLRLGGGRPLGFGEVHLAYRGARIRTGAELAARLTMLADDAAPSAAASLDSPARLVDSFLRVAPMASLRALEAAMRGYPADAHVSYPHQAGSDEIRSWFAANQHRDAGQYALPRLQGPEAMLNLPFDPGQPEPELE